MQKTKFASADRSGQEELKKDLNFLENQAYLTDVFNSVSSLACILNKNRQIVYVNNEYLQMLGISSIKDILGKRPGESISCMHANEEEAGCGTAEACSVCGAVSAILQCLKTGQKIKNDARITCLNNGQPVSLDLSVTAMPLKFQERNFIVITLQDISNEKRKSNLERIFFHDVMNSAGGINGLMKVLKETTDRKTATELINAAETESESLVDEIESYRQLSLAESGDLKVSCEQIGTIELIKTAVNKIAYHEIGRNKIINIEEQTINKIVNTDRVLLSRVLVNMLKNALEATAEGSFVRIGAEDRNENIRFRVKNNGIIKPEARMQMFQRSYSSKGENRGLGTYSIKLLGEKYLNGKVGFMSSDKDGTEFYIDIAKDN